MNMDVTKEQVNYKIYLMSDSYNPEVRRAIVHADVATSYVYLRHKIEMIFPSLQGNEFDVYWKDEDGDDVTIKSDEELTIALVSSATNPKKLYVNESRYVTHNKDGVSNTVHVGVMCDVCESQVKGYRYKCLQCRNFDLCEGCEAKHCHSEHVMLRLGQTVPHRMDKFWRKLHVIISHLNKDVEASHSEEYSHRSPCEEGHESKCKRGKWKHRKYPCFELNESDDEAQPHKEKKHKRVHFPECARSMFDLIQNYDVFVNPSVTRSEKEGAAAGSSHEAQPPRYLQSVGSAIASILNPFVEVASMRHGTPSPANDNSKKDKSEATDKEGPSPQTPSTVNEKSQNGDLDSNVQQISEKLAQQNISETRNEAESQEPNKIPGPSPTQSNLSQPTSTDQQSEGAQQPASKSSERLYPEVPKDPKIALALSQMLSMGFSNDGDWLLHLLEEKDGDIRKVLEYLENVILPILS